MGSKCVTTNKTFLNLLLYVKQQIIQTLLWCFVLFFSLKCHGSRTNITLESTAWWSLCSLKHCHPTCSELLFWTQTSHLPLILLNFGLSSISLKVTKILYLVCNVYLVFGPFFRLHVHLRGVKIMSMTQHKGLCPYFDSLVVSIYDGSTRQKLCVKVWWAWKINCTYFHKFQHLR